MASLAVFLILLLLEVIVGDRECPTSNYTQCICRWKLGDSNLRALFITCQDFQGLQQLPEMKPFSSKIEQFTIRDSTIDLLQEDAFGSLTISKLTIYKSGITMVDKDAFKSLNGTLEELKLGDNDFASLEEGTFDNMGKLEFLGLEQNSLEMLDESIFYQMPKLTYLHLQSNNLRFLPLNIFSELKYLRGLYLQKNNIESLNNGIFNGFDYLRELDLSFNSLYKLPSNIFSSLKLLLKLKLGNNYIHTLSVSLFHDTNQLQDLDLSGNRISTLPKDIFRGCGALQKLNLGNNFITELTPGSVEILIELTDIHFENNRLEHLPDNLFLILTDVRVVYLQDNLIVSLPNKLFQSCQDLQIVDLHNNRITNLPRDLFADGNAVQTLDLSDNKISLNNTKMFENLLQLIKLNLADNQISHLPAQSFRRLLQLQELLLDRNLLTKIEPQDFKGASELRTLNLSHNVISDIQSKSFEFRVENPEKRRKEIAVLDKLSLAFNVLSVLRRDMFYGGERLTLLELNNNLLETVPAETFIDLNSLQYMYLQNNFIHVISSTSFNILPNLLVLDLSNNSLLSLPPRAFSTLEKLEKLYLSHNMIKKILPNTFFGMASLEEIDLGYNKIKTISKEALNGVSSSLHYLSIAYNPLACNCSIFWLRGYKAIKGYNITVCMETEDSWKYVMCLYDTECYDDTPSLVSPNDTLCMSKVPDLITTSTTTTTTTSTSTTTAPTTMTTTSTEPPTTADQESVVATEDPKDMTMVYIIIGCILGLFLVVAGITVMVMIRRKKKANEMEEKLVSDLGSSVNGNIPPEEIAGKTFESYKIPTGNHKGADSFRWRSQGSDIDGSGQALPEIGEMRVNLVDEGGDEVTDVTDVQRERRFKKKSEHVPVLSSSNVEVNKMVEPGHLDREVSQSSPILSTVDVCFEAEEDEAEEAEAEEESHENTGEENFAQNIAVAEDALEEVSIEDNNLIEEDLPENHVDRDTVEPTSPPPAPPPPLLQATSPTRRNFMEGVAIPKSNEISRFYAYSDNGRKDLDAPPPVVDEHTITKSKGNVMDELGRRLSVVRGAFDDRNDIKNDVALTPSVQPTRRPASSDSNFMQDAIMQLDAYQKEKQRRPSEAAIQEVPVAEEHPETDDGASQKLYTRKSEPHEGEDVIEPQLNGSLDGMWPDNESDPRPPSEQSTAEGSTRPATIEEDL